MRYLNLRYSLNIKKRVFFIRNTFFKLYTPRNFKNYRNAAHTIVTPFLGFLLSNYHLSDEIEDLGLEYLNPKSKNLTCVNRKISEKTIIYCQIDQINEFINNHIEKISSSFILITGKWGLPGFKFDENYKKILKNRHLVTWFSQNQIYSDLPILHFPYGVNFFSAPRVLNIASKKNQKVNKVFIPFHSVHEHLDQETKELRQQLIPYMAKKKSIDDYLEDISKSDFVVSATGDRPDTYRHWEIIALGGTPISNLPQHFTDLFGLNLIIRPDLSSARFENYETFDQPSNKIVNFQYWEAFVNSKFSN